MTIQTIGKQDFLNVRGIQTMSHTYSNLMKEKDELNSMGITHFRLSPQNVGMVAVTALYCAASKGEVAADEASDKLALHCNDVPFLNGFYICASILPTGQ